ncbi:uncharacterized protein RCC_09442 [Ramularia collo-cygni]|uniref:Uncharacterized protein n=1 Tax=Ramularia collo-cygni TaxID=112498 RepID=A0A2D3VPA2_9PEZI|nr:uncharacterized protein RCC_09442 [Ramularia collo-cygni]CZT23728.1 uncharacterized protein RCC_09442 [Ramularia collo-cygni]
MTAKLSDDSEDLLDSCAISAAISLPDDEAAPPRATRAASTKPGVVRHRSEPDIGDNVNGGIIDGRGSILNDSSERERAAQCVSQSSSLVTARDDNTASPRDDASVRTIPVDLPGGTNRCAKHGAEESNDFQIAKKVRAATRMQHPLPPRPSSPEPSTPTISQSFWNTHDNAHALPAKPEQRTLPPLDLPLKPPRSASLFSQDSGNRYRYRGSSNNELPYGERRHDSRMRYNARQKASSYISVQSGSSSHFSPSHYDSPSTCNGFFSVIGSVASYLRPDTNHHVPSAAAEQAARNGRHGINTTGRADPPNRPEHFRTGDLVKANFCEFALNPNADPKTDSKYTQTPREIVQAGERLFVAIRIRTTGVECVPIQSADGKGPHKPQDTHVFRLIDEFPDDYRSNDGNAPARVRMFDRPPIKQGSNIHTEDARIIKYEAVATVVGAVRYKDTCRILAAMNIRTDNREVRWQYQSGWNGV